MATAGKDRSIHEGRTERLNMRLSPQALALIRSAAEAQNQDVSSFVLGTALDRARGVILEERFLGLTIEDIRDLEHDLDREPRVIEELASRMRRARNDMTVTRPPA